MVEFERLCSYDIQGCFPWTHSSEHECHCPFILPGAIVPAFYSSAIWRKLFDRCYFRLPYCTVQCCNVGLPCGRLLSRAEPKYETRPGNLNRQAQSYCASDS